MVAEAGCLAGHASGHDGHFRHFVFLAAECDEPPGRPLAVEERYPGGITRGKTGSLFSLSTQSGAILGKASEAAIGIMKDYGDNLGIAFQVVDDILDFTSTAEALGKPVGSDLRQGTLTLPAMMVMEQYPGDNPVRKYFETRDEKYTVRAVDMILNSSIIEECYRVAVEYRDRGCRGLAGVPDTASRGSLEQLGEYIINQGK